ncbi:MAG: HAD-IIIA family hydrolase [Bacteroidales bacterium]|nr:HAD-IIIA family hydrolase [Bacteroidales bacterium]MBQ6689847.1 HAD-IIIA family hydrolase [Bacteroidales bacterium]
MEEILKGIRAFVFDVDGVLTDGGILADLNGELYRTFDSKDGFGLRMATMHGYALGIITGGRSESIRARFRTCGILPEDVYLGVRDKIEDFQDFCQRHKVKAEEVMYFGDDLPDIPVLKACGCGVCPCDAVPEVLEAADFISSRPGGKGCAREAIEMVMKLQGEWQLDVQDYKKKF